jgi:predicted DNA-binding protein (MmcQ/YjbR family)
MDAGWVRRFAKSLPHSTETVQWGDNLVFKVGGRIFAILALEPADVWLSFKCSAEEFAELTDRPGIVPAPYLARAQWVALESEDALPASEIQRLLRQSYELVHARLSKRAQAELGGSRVRRAR